MRARLAITLWMALVAARSATAGRVGPEDPKPEVAAHAEVTVSLVQIEVRVEDKQGRFLSGLGSQDFAILEDGIPRSVEYADEVRIGGRNGATAMPVPGATPVPGASAAEPPARVPAEASSSREEAREASVALVVDGANSSPAAIRRQLPYLRGLLRSLDPATRAAVYQLGPDGVYRTLSDFSRDRRETLAALDQLRPGAGGDYDRSAKLQDLELVLTEKLGLCGRSPQADMCRATAYEKAIHTAESFATEERARARNSIASLRAVLAFSSRLAGARSVILVSEGIDPGGATYFSATARLIRFTATSAGVRDTDHWIQEVQRAAAGYQAEVVGFGEIARAASATGVTIYWVNPSHTGGFSPASPEQGTGIWQVGADYVGVAEPEQLMKGLATDTGGLALVRAAGVEGFYQRVASDVETYYLLSYTPGRDARDGREHRLEVKVGRPGARVRVRERFVDHQPGVREAQELARALDFPEDARDFPVATRVHWLMSGASYQVFYHVAVPYAALAPTPRGSAVEDVLRFGFVVRDGEGNLVRAEEGSVPVGMSQARFDGLGKAGAWLDYRHRMDLAPGKWVTSIAVLDTASHRSGSAAGTIELPVPGSRCVAVSPLLLASSIERLPERVDQLAFEPGGAVRHGDLRLAFSALVRVAPTGQLAGLYQLLHPRRGAEGLIPARVRFRLRRGGAILNETPESPLGIPEVSDRGPITNYFSVPYTALVPGDYRLELVVRDPERDCEAVSGAEFTVVVVASDADVHGRE